MPRPKGSKNKKLVDEQATTPAVTPEEVLLVEQILEVIKDESVVPNPIPFLSVDYPNEYLNDIARTLNKIIEKVNAL